MCGRRATWSPLCWWPCFIDSMLRICYTHSPIHDMLPDPDRLLQFITWLRVGLPDDLGFHPHIKWLNFLGMISGEYSQGNVHDTVPLRHLLRLFQVARAGIAQYRLDRWMHRSARPKPHRQFHPDFLTNSFIFASHLAYCQTYLNSLFCLCVRKCIVAKWWKLRLQLLRSSKISYRPRLVVHNPLIILCGISQVSCSSQPVH